MPKSLEHIAFIMDGNGRWATERGMSRVRGHEYGAKILKKIIEKLVEKQISIATFYVFSLENWCRPQTEVNGLMTLLGNYLNAEYAVFKKQNIRVKILGDLSPEGALSASHIKSMHTLMEKTASHTGMQLNLCINYSGQDELLRSFKKVHQKLQNKELDVTTLKPEDIAQNLDTAALPPVDLCIRTGGELRLSNFMLWQLSYAELFFTKTFWPDFSVQELEEILANYYNRQRRFGRLPKTQETGTHT